jgi:hypothetical protein
MSFFQVIQGLYYTLAGAEIVFSFLADDEDADVAQPQGAQVRVDRETGFGFLGFEAGLLSAQRVPEDTWATKIPVQFHFRRRRPKKRRLGPKEVEFGVTVEWYDFQKGDTITRRSFGFHGKEDFEEVTLESMLRENSPEADGTVIVLSDTTAEAITTSKKIAAGHPKYYSLITPTDTTGSQRPLQLSWRVEMKPEPGYSRKDIALWFDESNPFRVRDAPERRPIIDGTFQEIDYDYIVGGP